MQTNLDTISQLNYRHFKNSDYPVYKSWFDDEELNLQLGPMDEAWLKAIVNEPNSLQYSFILNDQLIGVLGLYLPEKTSEPVYITDITVRPDLRKQGYGTNILSLLQHSKELKVFQTWKASIHKNNLAALKMFTRLGWKHLEKSTALNDYLDVIFKR